MATFPSIYVAKIDNRPIRIKTYGYSINVKEFRIGEKVLANGNGSIWLQLQG